LKSLLLLAIWGGAITLVVSLDLADKHLGIPVFLALTGVFGSILPLAIALNIALVANAATLVLFIVSLERLKPKRRRAIAFVSHRS
jgi:cytochrome bd-type quinol oxidase subunit 1